MILLSIVLLTIVSISLRITILSLETAVFVMNRADNIRKMGETAILQSTRLKGKKTYRKARTLQIGVDTTVGVAKTAVGVVKVGTVLALKSTLKLIRFIVARLRDLLLVLESTVLILDIVIFLILVSASAGYMVLYCTVNDGGQIVYNLEGSSNSSTSGSSESNSSDTGSFTKYNLSSDEIQQIARLCYQEMGSVEGSAAEASLMCNLYESSRGEGYSSVYDYARNSGWFANSEEYMDSGVATDEVIKIVSSVIKDGKRVLPRYIDEQDSISDISSASNNNVDIDKNNKDSYTQFTTKVTNVYGSTCTFYCFSGSSDLFGYTSESLREEYGEDCYNIDSLKLELGL